MRSKVCQISRRNGREEVESKRLLRDLVYLRLSEVDAFLIRIKSVF